MATVSEAASRRKDSAANAFLRSGRVGRWQWYWAVLGTLVAVGVAIGSQIAGFWLVDLSNSGIDLAGTLAAGRWGGFLGLALLGLALLLGSVTALVLVHGRSPRFALGASQRLSWSDFAKAVGAGLLVALLIHCTNWWREPTAYVLEPRVWTDLPWMLLAALVLLPQSFGEEFAFRGYLARVWGAVIPVRFVIIALLGGLFTALHAENEDVARDLAFNLMAFGASEIVLYLIYLRSENLGATAGLHWLNNTFLAVAIAAQPGGISELALVRWTDPVLAAGGSRLTDPSAYLEVALGLGLLLMLLMWSRSPFYLPPARLRALEPDAVVA